MTTTRPYSYNYKKLGESLNEVSVDYIRTEQQEIKSRWFTAKDIDLFIWQDQNANIIKQQVSFYGLIVEWNLVEGLRTGVSVEEENHAIKTKASETICFDKKVSRHSVDQCLEIIKYINVLDKEMQDNILYNFTKSPKLDDLTAREIYSKYNYLNAPKQTFWAWLRALFKLPH